MESLSLDFYDPPKYVVDATMELDHIFGTCVPGMKNINYTTIPGGPFGNPAEKPFDSEDVIRAFNRNPEWDTKVRRRSCWTLLCAGAFDSIDETDFHFVDYDSTAAVDEAIKRVALERGTQENNTMTVDVEEEIDVENWSEDEDSDSSRYEFGFDSDDGSTNEEIGNDIKNYIYVRKVATSKDTAPHKKFKI